MTWLLPRFRTNLSTILFCKSIRKMATRSFNDALEKLNSLQSNFAAIEASRASGGRMVQFSKHETLEYLSRIGYTAEDLNRLNVIHVTGTKGKGSTCAFVDAIIRAAAPDRTIGLFTSPHLVSVRERIRINGAPISEEDFVKYFYEVWDRLEANQVRKYDSTPTKPMYFKYMNLVAYHAFLTMKVDATILEVGVGGEYDSTNAVPKPIAAGVASLGLDHVNVLGKTLKEIAWQKGGIYKADVPAFAVEQPDNTIEVLQSRATEKKSSSFKVVSVLPELSQIKLGLAGKHQLQNASLALHLAHTYLTEFPEGIEATLSLEPLSEVYKTGLRKARWPARCQAVQDPEDPKHSVWYLDGAHTAESLACCADWFISPDLGLRSGVKRVLIFNCTHGRAGKPLLEALISKIKVNLASYSNISTISIERLFDHVIFCTNVTYLDGTFKPDFMQKSLDQSDLAQLRTQTELANAWKDIIPEYNQENIHVVKAIEHAVVTIQQLRQSNEEPVDVLVAGSLLLVGGLIEVAGLTKVALSV